MIKPINSASAVHFGNGLEKYQEQVKANIEPEYNLVITPGSSAPKPRKGFKESIADTYKSINNTTSIIGGAVKGLVEGVIIGGVFGVVAKNIKDNRAVMKNVEDGAKEAVKQTSLKDTAIGCIKDVANCAINILKTIPEKIKDLPKKYSEYLGKDSAKIKAAIAGIIIITTAVNIIKAKIQANRRNADIDHSLNIRH